MPQMPSEAMTPGMAPETAPAGLPQPGTSFQVRLLMLSLLLGQTQQTWKAPFESHLSPRPMIAPASTMPLDTDLPFPSSSLIQFPHLSRDFSYSLIWRMRNKPAEIPYLRHPCVAESCCLDLPQTHSHSFQGFTHGRKLQEGVPAPAPGPAASRRAEARPMPPLPPLPAGAPEPGAAAGAQVWTRSFETCQMGPLPVEDY